MKTLLLSKDFCPSTLNQKYTQYYAYVIYAL